MNKLYALGYKRILASLGVSELTSANVAATL